MNKSCKIRPVRLRTDGDENPLGIGSGTPLFGWQAASGERGQNQSAYRLLVASSQEKLEEAPDCWDTGKVFSDCSVQIPYGGAALQSGTRCFWKLMIWDQDGAPSEWSEPAWFETGLLEENRWQGQWISGIPAPSVLNGSCWIWTRAAQTEKAVFAKSFVIPQGREILQAWFDGTADSRFTLYVNGTTVAKSNPEWGQSFSSPFCWIDFAGSLHAGENQICCNAFRKGGSGGFIGVFRLLLSGGETIVLRTDESWKASEMSGQEDFRIPPADAVPWQNAAVAAAYGGGPWNRPVRRGPTPLLHKEFRAGNGIVRARLYLCGLGYYSLTVNGKKPDDRLLSPAYTQYRNHICYDTYDVTPLLREGLNCIGVELGRGYYACQDDWIGPNEWHGGSKLLLQLNLTYADGSAASVVSDESWLCKDGPTFDDNIWYGEKYDAGKETENWDLPGFDASGWRNAVPAQAPAGALVSRLVPPIRIAQLLPCRLIGTPAPRTYVYDAGKITAGWAKITVRGQKGLRIRITYGEHLRENGMLDIWKDGCDMQFWETPQTDIYLCRGGGSETWEPKFSYKGFRYIQIEGPAEPCEVTAESFHNSVEKAGEFSCSNERFNSIHRMVCNTILNNLHSIPTDTPMHEKRGWTGDGQVISDCACNNFDMHNFFAKWVQDIEDTQGEKGYISHTCPGPVAETPAPAWTTALVLVPWALYQYYGDTEIFRRHYPAFQKYTAYELGRLKNNISTDPYYADWCTPDGDKAPEGPDLLDTAYVYLLCRRMAEIARLLKRDQDCARYSRAAAQIKETFNMVFLDAQNNVYHTGIEVGYRQTSNVLPLAFGLVPPEKIKPVADNLAQDVMVTRGGHLSTGCFGCKYLAPMLSEYGHHDAAYAIADQTTFPSWGYWLESGATACLEGWDMEVRSFDHYFLGTIDEWFYSCLAGIRPAAPGFKKVLFKPYLSDGLSFAEAERVTPYGTVSSRWERIAGGYRLEISVPANSSSAVSLPAESGSVVLENGIPAEKAPCVKRAGEENGRRVYETGSGRYRFEVLTPADGH